MGTPAKLMTVVAPLTAEAHWLGPKACTRGYGSFDATALGSRVSTLTVCPTAVSLDTSRLPTKPVAPAGIGNSRPGKLHTLHTARMHRSCHCCAVNA